MMEVEAASQMIREQAQVLAPRWVGLSEAAGTRLAESVLMDIDSPPFDRALVDGYAVIAADAHAGKHLQILGRQDAGMYAAFHLAPGDCVAINTGAPLPAGADAVIMVEETALPGTVASGLLPAGRARTHDSGYVKINKAVVPGAGIQRRGADAHTGHEVLPAGTGLGPAALAVAAAAGAARVHIIPPPRVAVLVTGDELVDPATHPTSAQIRNTNSVMLDACVRRSAASLVHSATAGDTADQLRAQMDSALALADVLVISGGMSMGTRDLVPDLLVERGFTIHIQKVRIKPGKPFIFGTLNAPATPSGTQYVLGLPGNPVSAFVCFQRFGRLLLDLLAGGTGEIPSRRAPLAAPIGPNGDREFYQPGLLKAGPDGQESVLPLPWRGSADIFTLAQANALILQPPHAPDQAAGSLVRALIL